MHIVADADPLEEESWCRHHERLEARARAMDPAVRLTTKDGWIWRAIARVLPIVTLGGIGRRRFLEDFATTLGPLQAYPRRWPVEEVEARLMHEARHTWQSRIFGFGLHPWLGVPLLGVVYLLLPLPLGLAWARFRLELDADVAAWRQQLADGVDADEIRRRALAFATTVSSGAYGWAWPRRWARRAFLRAAEREISRSR